MRWETITDEAGVERVRKVIERGDYLSWARVPDRHCRQALEARKTRAVALVDELLAGKGRLLVLHADVGRGKSVAAAYGLSMLGGLWVSAPDLARVVQRRDEGDDSVRRETLDEQMASRKTVLLVIDDAGLEHSPSGYAGSRICEAIVSREAAGLRTVVTTNLAGDVFKTRYGERIASRMNGDSLGWQTIEGPDLRSAPLERSTP